MCAGEKGPEAYVSRGGQKLSWALDRFGIEPSPFVCADLGANVGGFTHCLLSRGAKKVYAVDTGYGVLDWRLRRDERVVVMERTNALHVTLPQPCDLVVIDLGWTPQRLSLPKAREMINPDGKIISLVKPQYEAPKEWVKSGRLQAEQAQTVINSLLAEIPKWQLRVLDWAGSPLPGRAGNREYFLLLALAG